MVPREFLVPYLIANVIGLAVLALAFWRPRIARWVGVAVFAWAAATNAITSLTHPEVYVDYATLTPSGLYRDFILGWFSRHVQLIVLPIAMGQLIVAALLASRRDLHRRIGLAWAIVFLLAIAPLGVGAGFPFSLTFGLALLVSLGTLRVASPRIERVLWWSPRVFGLGLCVFLSLFALDAFGSGKSIVQALPAFAIHLVPAAVVLAVVAVAWRWEWVGGIVFFVLAIAYAILTHGYLSWMLVISGPLVVEGLLFLWSWRHHDMAQGGSRHAAVVS